MARWFSWLECRPVTAEVVGSSPIRVAILPRQLSWQSKGLKILVSTVRFCAEAPFMRKQLSGRAPPCQGGGREFESRFPLQLRRHSQAVRQRSAKPSSPVRFWVPPPYFFLSSCRGGGTGRRKGLKIPRGVIPVPVRFRSAALVKNGRNVEFTAFLLFFCFKMFEHL